MGATVNVRLFDGAPVGPFCTIAAKFPAANVVVPLNCVEVFVKSALFAMLHGDDAAQPGPVRNTFELFGSNPEPDMVKANACPFRGGFGVVEIALS